jgi:serine/threonine protein kinase
LNSIGNILSNNKESWKSKETTSKGSIESRNSNFSHSPPKENEEENRKNNKIYINIDDNNYSENDEIEEEEKEDIEDDIIPPEKINYEEENYIEDNKIKEDKSLYDHIQRRLKKILVKGRLPRFNLDKYTIEKQIGDGSFGIIYSVYNNTSKRKYAMKKIIANNINALEAFQKEFEISYHDKHPSIIDIKGVCIKCYDQTTYVLYVLMDLADNDWEMEINDRENNKDYYQEKDLISILKQLSSALYFLQKEKKTAHRDIKCENVLIFKNKTQSKNKYGEYLYKICDFGEAKDFALSLSSKNKTIRGTELYMSPLLYNGLLHDESYVEHNAYKSDVFSLGCCMIIAAALDFDIISEIRELKEQIKIARFLKKKLLPRYSEKFVEVLLKMINFNEKERFDFIQLEEIIETTL